MLSGILFCTALYVAENDLIKAPFKIVATIILFICALILIIGAYGSFKEIITYYFGKRTSIVKELIFQVIYVFIGVASFFIFGIIFI